MAGYLDNYGAEEERRGRVFRRIWIAISCALALGLVSAVLSYVFYNWREERQVKHFLADLAAKDYKSAYAMFGCTDAKPCTAYAFDKFMEDFGPATGHDPSRGRVAHSQSCGSGVILTVDYGSNARDILWVERKDLNLSFPPFQECPPGGRVHFEAVKSDKAE